MNFKYELPYCYTCYDWHFPGAHVTERFQPPRRQSASYRRYTTGTSANPPPREEPREEHDARAYFDQLFGSPARDAKLAAALETLGLEPDADKVAARRAFRRAVSESHPDHGGSAERTKHVLAARDVLRARGRI